MVHRSNYALQYNTIGLFQLSYISVVLYVESTMYYINENVILLLNKAAVSLCMYVCTCVSDCLSVCTPLPFFRHDRLTAAKFGTHMRIDPGIIRAQKKLTHGLGGSKIQKSGKCHELLRKSIKKM